MVAILVFCGEPIVRDQCLGRFLDMTGWDPSVCKPNQLYIDILRFSFIKLGYILWIPLNDR